MTFWPWRVSQWKGLYSEEHGCTQWIYLTDSSPGSRPLNPPTSLSSVDWFLLLPSFLLETVKKSQCRQNIEQDSVTALLIFHLKLWQTDCSVLFNFYESLSPKQKHSNNKIQLKWTRSASPTSWSFHGSSVSKYISLNWLSWCQTEDGKKVLKIDNSVWYQATWKLLSLI